ncbi:M20/M25/M40 family metallo-hydrolase [Geotalea sp. SG265]|uniref:M20/M25/M40 family metallo-hydrolase n=1 Tax=Geotalea sp. SG265 TaxID=2922867 RepID=UPI001FAEBDF4|nr:M20/M25/M40 family metallo-hydrolase [Geotalea sp. SG265]
MTDRQRLHATFMELCSIDSEPKNERPMADRLTGILRGLGFSVTEDDTGRKIGGNAGNLIARLDGTRPGASLLFSCHMDRVAPGVGVKPRIEGDYIISDGTTVLGADDAAGLAAIIEGLTVIREQNILHPPLEIVFTVAEELALTGSAHLDSSLITSRCGFVLDAGGPVGEIVVQAPEQAKINAVFVGRSAHAGFAPEEGISAIQMAALAITRMKLLRIDPETTANIGSIQAMGPTNIVCDRCSLQAEARSLDPQKLQAQVEGMVQTMKSVAAEMGGTVEVEIQRCYPSYQLDGDAEPVRRSAEAAARIGVPVRFKPTGGGSDANHYNNRGIPAVVLSCGYEKVHTTGERIALEQLDLLARWVVEIITG